MRMILGTGLALLGVGCGGTSVLFEVDETQGTRIDGYAVSGDALYVNESLVLQVVEGGEGRQVAKAADHLHEFAGDDDQLYYREQKTTDYVAVDAASGTTRRLTPNASNCLLMAMLPDALALTCATSPGAGAMIRLPKDGSAPVRLAEESGAVDAYSDGQYVYFGGDTHLKRVSLSGGGVEQLAALPSGLDGLALDVTPAGDGWLFVTERLGAGRKTTVHFVSRAGVPRLDLYTEASDTTWSSQGEGVVYLSTGGAKAGADLNGTIVRVDDAGQVETLVSGTGHVTHLHASGDTLYWLENDREAEVTTLRALDL